MQLLSVIFQWVISSSLMAVILIGIILLSKLILKDKVSARWSYYIWFLVILRLALPFAPQSSISIFNVLPSITHNVSIDEENVNKVDKNMFYNLMNDKDKDDKVYKENKIITVKDYSFQRKNIGKSLNIEYGLIIIWIIGMVIFLTYTIVINFKFLTKVKKDNRINNLHIDEVFNECKYVMEIKKDIPIISTKEVYTPSLIGIMKPRLLIPEYLLEKINNDEFKYIFLHELSHLKRKDILVNWLVVLIQIVHWFNPFIWYGFYKMRNDCEVACDSLAISYLEKEERRSYGLTIIHLLEFMQTPSQVLGVTGMLNNKSNTKRRIKMISLFNKKPFKYTVVAGVVFFVIAGVTLTNARKQEKLELVKNINVSEEVNDASDKDSQIDYEEIKGEGIVVTLKDAKDTETDNNGIVNYIDIKNLVNEVIDAGAKVVSLNDKIVVQNSEIFYDGMEIIIDGNKISHPFIIKAVGDKNVLYETLSMTKSKLCTRGLDVMIQKIDEIVIND